jgi:hypothetical protein
MSHSGQLCYLSSSKEEFHAMKKTGAFFACMLLLGLNAPVTAEAGQFRLGHKYNQSGSFEISQYAGEQDNYDNGSYAVTPSQAASIARETWPGAKVLRVQLLPSGVYAVTLKQGGEVSRVLVDASSGEVV